MKKLILICVLLMISIGYGQEDAWVYFNAKPNAQTALDNPLTILSQRAIDRRTNQKIAFDFKDAPLHLSYVTQVKLVAGITVLAKSKWLNALHIQGTQTAINSLKNLSFVSKVDFANKALNGTSKLASNSKVEKSKTKFETQVNYPYGNSANQVQMLNGHLLHQQNFTGQGKIIAVLDSGFPGVNTAQPFQRLRDNNQILGGYDYVGRNADFYTKGNHGTYVLSTIGGYKENSLVGTAPDAKFYLFITENEAQEVPLEESLWVEAAERADSLGVDIINTSLGYFKGFDKVEYDHTYSQMDGKTNFITKGANIAFERGMIVVASAGNEGASTVENHIGSPADGINVIAVGAVNSAEVVTTFSSIGNSFDGRVKPDVMAQGQAVTASDPSGNMISINGTSFSGPITAGMVACLWEALPTKTNAEIKQIILQSADRFANPTIQYGFGIPDYSLALNTALSVQDFLSANIALYPNPTQENISLALPNSFTNGTLKIYSVLGLKMDEIQITQAVTSVSLASLSNGIYVYQFEYDGLVQNGKLIKN